MQVAEEIGGVQLPGIFGKRATDAPVAGTAPAPAPAAAAVPSVATVEVPVQASMTVKAKRATD
jgi:hypothetical protein